MSALSSRGFYRCRALTGLATGALLLGVAGACGDDTLPEQPDLPPVQTLTADITAVEQAPVAAKATQPDGVGVYTNFANAWVRVKLLQAYAAGVVLLPATAVGLALSQEPTFEGGRWLWQVSVLGASVTLGISGNAIKGWNAELRVTNGDLDDFLWVAGTFDSRGEGSWTLNDPQLPASQPAALEINWRYTSETDYMLEYVNANQASADVGDKVSYTLSAETATVVFEDASDETLVARASWSVQDGAGSIEVPLYNNGEKACWDTEFKNSTCL